MVWMKKAGKGVLIAFLSLTLIVCVAATVAVLYAGAQIGAIESDLDAQMFAGGADRTTRLYYYKENGEAAELSADRISGYENALYCPLSAMSPHLINAFIAIEDKRFWQHGGVDWIRTGSAVLEYAKNGSAHFGGSTITQQLIKNVTGDTERSVRRKAAEVLRAVKLEKMLSKEQILEQYLNVVNLSENCYGVRTASNAYFSKEPGELSLAEAATIAAITNNPAKYDPIRHPEANRARRDVILREMVAQNMIDEAAYEEATAGESVLKVNRSALSGRVNSWYADMVVNDVIAALVRERGMSEAAASRLVYCGGLKIYTAMRPELQAIVTAYYEDPDNFPTHEGGKKAQSGLLLVDPRTGDILAAAGAVGEKTSNRIRNFAIDAKRPSGSVIKPLSVYAPAFAKGLITYATVFDDIPLDFRENGAPWPRNSPDIYRGLTTVNTAVVHSVNTVSVSVLNKLGAKASMRYLRDTLGFSSLDEKNDLGAAALALGQQSEGVTLREIVGGYTALANGGVYRGTRSYTLVTDSAGRVLLENKGEERRALDEADAAILTMMLRGAVREGTGKAVTLDEIVDVAGKTGTSGQCCDKWFVGYTPELLCGVWYGYEYPAPLSDVKGNPALTVFDEVMHRILEVRPAEKTQFETPEDVVLVRYCRDSGLLLSDACALDPRGDRSEYGYFKKGTEPTAHCGCHVCVSYCSHGGVSTAYCPEHTCHKTALLRVKREFPRQIAVEDAPYTWDGAMPDIERILSYNEPYYAANYDSKQYFGVRMGLVPYNRACPAHTEDAFWRRRADVA